MTPKEHARVAQRLAVATETYREFIDDKGLVYGVVTASGAFYSQNASSGLAWARKALSLLLSSEWYKKLPASRRRVYLEMVRESRVISERLSR